MAGNSSTYEIRKAANDNNIKRWQDWSYSINYVVDQFNDVITGLNERLNLAETTIEALNTKISQMSASVSQYVKLQYTNIELASSSKATYTKSCGVFSNSENNVVYIYSDTTLNGLYVNNTQVEKKKGTKFLPFIEIAGSDTGTIVNIKTKDTTKIGSNIKLYFSLDSSIDSLVPSSSTCELVVKLNYDTIVTKQLITLDKSQLTKTIIEKVPTPLELNPVKKFDTVIGQYSSLKTASNTAKLKAEYKKLQ